MDGWMDGWINGWVDELIDGWMDEWMGRWMDGWVDRGRDGRMEGLVHGPDRVTVHPPPPGQSETKFLCSLDLPRYQKSMLSKKGMDYLFRAIFKMAASKIWKSRFVP